MLLAPLRKSLLCSPLVAAALFTGIDSAHALSRRIAFDPDYGAPFASLGWRGEAIVDYGTCDGPGVVTNLAGSCNGALSFRGAQVQLYLAGNPANPTLQTLHFTGGQVALMSFDAASEPTAVFSSPFDPVQGSIEQSTYNGDDQAWFSLVFVGNYAQLMWFDDNPGNALLNPFAFPYVQLPEALTYAGCYLFGVNTALEYLDSCGISSNLDSRGAALKFSEVAASVPEPETYALMLAGLVALALTTRRRSAKR